jgi:2-dehydropantoate 2-reductase
MALRIGIFGAGAIGGYLGVRLSGAGHPVTLVGRADLASHRTELVAVELNGTEHRAGSDIVVSTDPSVLAEVDICLVTVKSADTAAAGAALKPHLKATTPVISLQNGLHNAATLAEPLGRPAVAGMITYNVRREGPARFRKATSGPIMFGRGEGSAAKPIEQLAAALSSFGEAVELRRDMDAVLLTKLLLNLNNGLCALTGLSIAESVRSRPLRRAFSVCMLEGIRVARANHLPLTRIGPLSPALVARALTLPDVIFFRVAKSMMAIDPSARSSTLQDLDRGRATEIDYLSGEIVQLARKAGVSAPANEFVTREVHRLEGKSAPPPFLTPDDVLRSIQATALRA